MKFINTNFTIEIVDRLIIFLFAICLLIYSSVSSNLPRSIQYSEIILGFTGSLLIFTFILKLKNFYTGFEKKELIVFLILIILLFYMLVLGLKNYYKYNDIIRDCVAFLPFFSFFLLKIYFKKKKIFFLFVKILYIVGLIFSVKVLIFRIFFYERGMQFPIIDHKSNFLNINYEFLYLEILIIFALTLSLIKMIEKYLLNKKKYIIYGIFYSVGTYVIVIYNFRVNLVAVFFLSFLYFFLIYRKINLKLFLVYLTGFLSPFFFIIFDFFFKKNFLINKILGKFFYFLFYFLLFYFFFEIFFKYSYEDYLIVDINGFLEKFTAHGFNNRFQEYNFIYNQFSQNLYGTGFGSFFYNPTTNSFARFLHNFFLYYIYKAGIIGLFFSLSIYIMIFIDFINLKNNHYITKNEKNLLLIKICSIASLIYPMTFGANFKSLTFGIVLGLFLSIRFKNEKNF